MLDVDSLDINKILKDLERLPDSIHSRPDATGASKAATSHKNTGNATIGHQTLPLMKVAVPDTRLTAILDVNTAKGAASTQNHLKHIPGTAEQNPTPHSGNERRQTEECPPLELRALIEADERRAAKTAENIKIYTAAINGVENALTPLSKGSSVQFIDSMKVYVRAAIAHFMIAGPGTTLPSLPPRPEIQAMAGKTAESTVGQQSEPQRKTAQAEVHQPKTTWASITRNGLQSIPVLTKAAQSTPKVTNSTRTAKISTGPTKPALQDETVSKMLELPQTKIEYVYRVPTGFAIRAENQEARTLILSLAGSFAQQDAILEKATDLTSLRIATVPVAINTIMGRVLITEEMVTDDIVRITKTVPVKVRPHGKGRLGAPYQSWVALFDKATTPRPGFRLFDDSGIAVRHQSRQGINQCKRCLQFHGTVTVSRDKRWGNYVGPIGIPAVTGTRGCSRAPACWNCSSTVHSTAECKAHTKCRNCGGPHRSDSRDCLAHPTNSGMASKDNLQAIRQASQRDFAAVTRAKAAVRRAEAAMTAAAEASNLNQPGFKSSNCFEVLMSDATATVAELYVNERRKRGLNAKHCACPSIRAWYRRGSCSRTSVEQTKEDNKGSPRIYLSSASRR
ncbi:TE1a [Blumeria hordei DH14]|uniref:TE1a n=1 Tax=Blumeria graminis f. sp. hordei (strain DH14) TaxID=546991 RepID=N1JIY6_BLUG1|nr:TE1a [Blumeria hordei DH14]